MRLEDIAELEGLLGRDDRASAEAFAALLRRLREEHPAPLLPAPPADAKPPPKPWSETDEDGA